MREPRTQWTTPPTADSTPANADQPELPPNEERRDMSSPSKSPPTPVALPCSGESSGQINAASQCFEWIREWVDSALTDVRIIDHSGTASPSRGAGNVMCECVSLIQFQLNKINETLRVPDGGSRQTDFDLLGTNLSLLYLILSCIIVSRDASSTTLNATLTKLMREMSAETRLRCSVPFKVGKYRSALRESDTTDLTDRVSISVREKVQRCRSVLSEVEQLWASIQQSAAEELAGVSLRSKTVTDRTQLNCDNDTKGEAALHLLYTTPLDCETTLWQRTRLLQLIARSSLNLGVFRLVLVRLMDSIALIRKSPFISISTSQFRKPNAGVKWVFNSFSNDLVMAFARLSAIWATVLPHSSTRAEFLVLDEKLPNPRTGIGPVINEHLSEEQRRIQHYLEYDVIAPLTRQYGLSGKWAVFLLRTLNLYLHIVTLFIAGYEKLSRAIEILGPYLDPVLTKIKTLASPAHDLRPTGNEERPRRLSWARATSKYQLAGADATSLLNSNRSRSLSDTSGSTFLLDTVQQLLTADGPLLQLSKKCMPPEFRPDASLPDVSPGFCLLSPSTVAAATSLYRQINNPLEVWVLMCVMEAQPDVCEILNLEHGTERAKLSNTGSDQLVEWLTQCALEGASMLENRLGKGTFTLDGQSSDATRYEDFLLRGECVYRVFSLRFAQLPGDTQSLSAAEMLIALEAQNGNQESLWGSGLVRLIGDLLLSTVFENGVPIRVLADQPVGGPNIDLDIAENTLNLNDIRREKRLSMLRLTQSIFGTTLHMIAEEEQRSQGGVRELQTRVSGASLTLSGVVARLSTVEAGLTNSLEGPVARHTYQIKSLMNRLDSTDVELRRLQGVSSTQHAALTNRINEVRRNLQNLETKSASRLENPTESGSEVGLFDQDAATLVLRLDEDVKECVSNYKNIQRDLQALKRDLGDELDSRLNEKVEPLRAMRVGLMESIQQSLTDFHEDFAKLKNKLESDQRTTLNEILKELQQGSAQELRNRHDEPARGFKPHQLLDMADRRFVDIIASVDERFARWASSQDIEQMRSSLERVESHLMTMEAKTRITENALGGNDKWGAILATKFRELERRLESELEREASARTSEILQELQSLQKGMEEHFNIVADQQKSEFSEAILSLKKKIKHEYLTQLIAKIDNVQGQVDNMSNGFTQPSIEASIQHLNERMEDGLMSSKGELSKLQWELNDVRRTMDTMLSASMAEIQSLRADVERIRRDKKAHVEERDNKIRGLEANLERSRSEIAEISAQMTELRSRTKLMSEGKGRRLHFWAGSRRDSRSDRPSTFGSNSSKFILEGVPCSDLSPSTSPYMVPVEPLPYEGSSNSKRKRPAILSPIPSVERPDGGLTRPALSGPRDEDESL